MRLENIFGTPVPVVYLQHMITQELIQFIKEQLAAGKTRPDISRLLHDNGWAVSDIDEGFDEVVPTQAPVPVVPPTPVVAVMPAVEPVSASEPIVEPVMEPVAEPVVNLEAMPAQPIIEPAQSQPVVAMTIHPAATPEHVIYVPEQSTAPDQIVVQAAAGQAPHVIVQPISSQPAAAVPQQVFHPIEAVQPTISYQQAPAYQPPVYQPPVQPAQSYVAPSYSAPAYNAPAYSAPAYVAPAQPIPGFQVMQPAGHSFRNPSGLLAFGMLIVSSIIAAGLSLMIASLRGVSIPLAGVSLVALQAVVVMIASLFAAAILNVSTKVVKVPGANYAKAVVFLSMQMVIGIAFGLTTSFGMPGLAVFLVGLVAWFALFIFYYESQFLKTLLVFILDLVFSILLGVIVVLILGALGVGVMKYFTSADAFKTVITSQNITQTAQLVPLSTVVNNEIVVPAVANSQASAASGASANQQAVPEKTPDDAVLAFMSSARAQAAVYVKDHKNYGESPIKNFCLDQMEGLASIPEQQVPHDSIVGSCRIPAVSAAKPAKTFTVMFASSSYPGTSFCTDQTGFIGSIGAMSSNKTYVAGVRCK